jgi:hypothetical protein
MRGLVASSVIVAACGGGSKAPVSSKQAGADPGLPAHYAALFRKGEAWTYTFDHAYRDDSDPKHDANGRVAVKLTSKCTVVDARALGDGAFVSDIACTPEFKQRQNAGTSNPIPGVWFADARGLWRVQGPMPAGTAKPEPDGAMVIAASPAAGPQVVGEYAEARVERRKAAWCVTVTATAEGPGSTQELCFADGGIESGMSDFRPGSEHDLERLDFSIQR